MKKSILFVDDEPHVLESLNNLFSNGEYNIHLASSGETALEVLGKNKIDLIISDILMPNMGGHELLNQIKKTYPRVVRVILSKHSDENFVLKAIQKKLAKLYIHKPYDDQYLLDTVKRIFEFKKTITSPELIKIISNFEGLPTLPTIYNDICEAIDNDDDINKISKMIEKDQAITTQVLHVSNSAYYGMKTSSIHQAIINVGLNNVKDIVFATLIFNKNLYPSMMKHLNKLWEHAYICNQLTLILYQKIFNKKISTNFLSAGLLHDIGKLLLLNIFGSDYFDLLSNDCIEDEKNKLGITHQQIGGYLLDWWELPLPIVEVVLYHHEPLNDMIINKDLVAIVHLADYYSSHKLGIEPNFNLNEEVFDYLDTEKSRIEEYIEEYLN